MRYLGVQSRFHAPALLALVASVFVSACFSPDDEPASVMQDGRVVGIQSCSHPREEHVPRCRDLFCQKALYDRKLLPPNTVILKSSHSYNYSDSPGRSVHVYKYQDGREYRYPMCEMQGLNVVRADEYSAKSQDW